MGKFSSLVSSLITLGLIGLIIYFCCLKKRRRNNGTLVNVFVRRNVPGAPAETQPYPTTVIIPNTTAPPGPGYYGFMPTTTNSAPQTAYINQGPGVHYPYPPTNSQYPYAPTGAMNMPMPHDGSAPPSYPHPDPPPPYSPIPPMTK